MRVVVLFMCFCFVYGCKSKQKLVIKEGSRLEQSRQNDITEKQDYSLDSTVWSDAIDNIKKESDTEVEIIAHTVEYDTSKPSDPETGKPPVARESGVKVKLVSQKQEAHSGKESGGSSVRKKEHDEKSDKSSDYRTEDMSGSVSESRDKEVFRIPWLWVIVGAGGILFVGYCIKANPFKALWKRLK